MNRNVIFGIVAVIVLIVGGIVFFRVPRAGTPQPISATGASNATYFIEGQSVTLVNGESEKEVAPGSATKSVTKIFGSPVSGDLNGDGKIDEAVLLVQNSGGTGTFYYVAAAINKGTSTQGTNAILLGDRIAPQTIEIKAGQLIANYADRKPQDSFATPPSVGVSKYLMLDGATLKEALPAHTTVEYRNDQYGFSIPLSESWRNYSVLFKTWVGQSMSGSGVSTSGAMLVIRHPAWTASASREDMPVMIFTPQQWNLVVQEKISLGAAPIPPSVLAQNSQFIFALPARYNYDYKPGWEEVDAIVHTLTAFEPAAVLTYINASSDNIKIATPFPGAVTGREFSVLGQARGNWFFEATFPTTLLDKDGKVLAQAIAHAKSDWMTEDFVPFKADYQVPASYGGAATLVLKRDNPSGLLKNDASVSFPITIEY